MTEGNVRVIEGHLEVLSRIGSSRNRVLAKDVFNSNLSHVYVTDLLKWGLIEPEKNALETLGPYQLTDIGEEYLKKVLKYSSRELSLAILVNSLLNPAD